MTSMPISMKRKALDNWDLNAGWTFVLGALFMVAGSISTGWYFGGAFCALAGYLLRLAPFRLSRSLWIAMSFPLLLMASKIPSALFYENAEAGWRIVGSNLQLVFMPIMAASLLLTPRIDYFVLFTRALGLGLPIAFLTGLWQAVFMHSVLPEGMMGNTLVYSSLTLTAGFLCLANLDRESGFWRLVAILGLLSAVGIVGLTLNPTTLLLLFMNLLLFAIFKLAVRRPSAKQILLIAVAVCGFVAVGYYAAHSNNRQIGIDVDRAVERLKEDGVSISHFIDDNRLVLYRHGLRVFAENPLSGVGLQNTVGKVGDRAQEVEGIEIKNYTHLNNEYLNSAAGSGVAGLLLTIAFLMAPLVTALASNADERYVNRVYFGGVLTLSFTLTGLTNLVTNHDLMLGFFSSAFLILVVANEQARLGARLTLARVAEPNVP